MEESACLAYLSFYIFFLSLLFHWVYQMTDMAYGESEHHFNKMTHYAFMNPDIFGGILRVKE